jgi:GH24 family phage-related lysozyme (muramidase)
MKASEKCLELIRRFEGFRSKAYRCPAGVWTIGYGSTRYADGTRVHQSDPPITEAQADDIMRATLGEYERAVDRYVSVFVNQNEFDALVDFAYNAGAKNLLNSTLLKKLNAGDRKGAAKEFERWVYADGQILGGLVRRRMAERVLFETAP